MTAGAARPEEAFIDDFEISQGLPARQYLPVPAARGGVEVKPPIPANLQYQALLEKIRLRFETIKSLEPTEESDIVNLEAVAFQLRKIIEGLAFCCLVALENGLKSVPRDASGQWNADRIFAKVSKREGFMFPWPVRREDPPEGADPEVKHHMVTVDDALLKAADLRKIYQDSHVWVHEWNPYVDHYRDKFESRRTKLLTDVQRLHAFLRVHMVGIAGEVFIGIVDDPQDGAVRVIAASGMK